MGFLMQMIVLRLIGIAAQVVEEVSGILADFLIGGEDGHIGIKSGCLIVIIAGSQMDIADDPVMMFLYDHRDLAESSSGSSRKGHVHRLLPIPWPIAHCSLRRNGLSVRQAR